LITGNGLYHRFHRTHGLGHARIGTITVDLIARELGLRTFTRDHDRTALSIHLYGMLVSGFDRQKEQRPQHLHHVIVGVLVVIEEDDVVERGEAVALGSSGLWSGRGDGQLSNGRMNEKGGATDSTGLHPSWEVVPGSELP